MKRTLITGGLGYVGGRLACHLKKEYPRLEIVLTTRREKKKLPSWADDFILTSIDFRDEKSIGAALEGVDLIIHLAALNEIDSMKDPVAALDINTRGTYLLLQGAAEKGIKKVIYFSTFHVYGQPEREVISEETPTRPFHPYAYTHRAAEDVVRYFNHYKGLDSLIFRLSNSYGYPMDSRVNRWTLVFNDLCRQAVTEGKITLNSSGRQYRDFIALGDVCGAVSHFLAPTSQPWGGELYNLGGGCSLSILDVAEKVREIYERKYGKKLGQLVKKETIEEGEPFRYHFSIDKLKKRGWSPEGNMEMEIEKTLELCQEFLP